MTHWRHSRCERWARSDAVEPVGQPGVPGAPAEIWNSSVESKGAGERDLRHGERAAHQRMADLPLPQIGHPPAALSFVQEDRG